MNVESRNIRALLCTQGGSRAVRVVHDDNTCISGLGVLHAWTRRRSSSLVLNDHRLSRFATMTAHVVVYSRDIGRAGVRYAHHFGSIVAPWRIRIATKCTPSWVQSIGVHAAQDNGLFFITLVEDLHVGRLWLDRLAVCVIHNSVLAN